MAEIPEEYQGYQAEEYFESYTEGFVHPEEQYYFVEPVDDLFELKEEEDEGEVEQVEVQPALLLHPLDPLAVVVEGDVEEGADDDEADDELLVDPVLHAQVQLRKITATLHDENLKTNC